MALQNVNFQWLGNIITITSLTSLAIICGILKRDNDRLAAQLRQWRKEVSRRQETALPAKPPAATPGPVDIREFVAQRSQNWMNAQASNTSAG